MEEIRFVLTKPVDGGTRWWTIAREVKGPDGWIVDPAFQLVQISTALPNAETEARGMIARLDGVVIGE